MGYVRIYEPLMGTLWAWGANGTHGYLGLDDQTDTDRAVPTQVGTDVTWQQVYCGVFHTLAIKANRTLWTWGYGGHGQLGHGENADKFAPYQLGSDTWTSASGGYYHSLGVKTDGTLWAWGRNATGELGTGLTDGVSKNTPQAIGTGLGKTWVQVSCGGYHSLALASDGTIWAWGQNWFSADKWGHLGQGDAPTEGTPLHQYAPVQVGSATDWRVVYGGYISSAAIKTNGTLWTWGGNHRDILGRSTDPINSDSTPGQVGSATTWLCAPMHSDHVIATQTDGTLWVWGNNEHCQLAAAYPGVTQIATPTQRGTDTDWARTGGGYYQGCARKTTRTAYCWGENSDGQVGNNAPPDDVSTPYQLPGTWIALDGGLGFHVGIRA